MTSSRQHWPLKRAKETDLNKEKRSGVTWERVSVSSNKYNLWIELSQSVVSVSGGNAV